MTISKFYKSVNPGDMTVREAIDPIAFAEVLADHIAKADPNTVGVHIELLIAVSLSVRPEVKP